ncbi:MAG: hypothetical protein ACYS3N_10560 [Planctomycetota bacterium]
MKRTHIKAIICIIVVILLIGGLKIYLLLTPPVILGGSRPAGLIFDPNTKASRVFSSVSDCAVKQKGLYGYIEAYRTKHGKLPDSINTLINDDVGSMHFINCPLGFSYSIYPENYGNPKAVFISEAKNKHSNTLSLWIRGIKPRVQTMGDGTIYMFKDGKVAKMNAKMN